MSEAVKPLMDVQRIMELIPHRYPMLLVDRILELEKASHIVGLKNVTMNEPFFQGHYPGHPIMPGVLIIEALAQTSGVLAAETVGLEERKLVYFTSIDAVKFRKPVVPGDQLHLHSTIVANKRNLWKMEVAARVNGETVTSGMVSAMMMDNPDA